MSLSAEELGPLSNCQQCDSARNKEIQALMLSMRVDTELNPYIVSILRGGLWSPHPWIVSIAEACELIFKNNTNKEMMSHLPVETMGLTMRFPKNASQ